MNRFFRTRGQRESNADTDGLAQGWHSGGPGSYTDPNFGYRYKNGSMTAGTLRVIFELGEVSQQDGGTQFILGSYAQPTILSFTSLWRPAPDEPMFCAGTKQISRWRRLSCGGARRRFST